MNNLTTGKRIAIAAALVAGCAGWVYAALFAFSTLAECISFAWK